MQHKLNAQNKPAAPRRAWVTPELRSLDVKSTRSGALSYYKELYDDSGYPEMGPGLS